MSYLPAPYEAAKQDDLPAALGAGLTVTVAGITSWILGHWAYQGIRTLVDLGKARNQLPRELVVTSVGWSIAVALMVTGGLLLAFRRGRGALILGALISIATTAIARYSFGLGSAAQPVPQWALYWGGVVVLLVAVLPATGRWIARTAPAPAYPTNATRPFGS
ncbi:hypothetical protein ABIB25_003697 [Nakamurella sp. UYEF19]|uniref:hypothetical protein n=1 Tax=Nakamurella sp. UYEF19 TaxID=1756392 RepID=UPI003396276C